MALEASVLLMLTHIDVLTRTNFKTTIHHLTFTKPPANVKINSVDFEYIEL